MSDQPAPLTSTLVLSLRVDVAAPVKIGPSDLGERQYIPITGGADRQLTRAAADLSHVTCWSVD